MEEGVKYNLTKGTTLVWAGPADNTALQYDSVERDGSGAAVA